MVYDDYECPDFDQRLAEYLARRGGFRGATTRRFDNYNWQDMLQAFRSDELDLAFMTPLTYISLHRELPSVSAVASYNLNGTALYNSVIVWKANKASGLEQVVKELDSSPASKIALVSRSSTSGYLWPEQYIKKKFGKNLGADFLGNISWAGAHPRVLEKLLADEVVAAATYEEQLDRLPPSEKALLKSESIRPAIPRDPVVMSDRVARSTRETLLQALLHMRTDNEGASLLVRCFARRIDEWIPAADSDYDIVRQFLLQPFPVRTLRVSQNGSHVKAVHEAAAALQATLTPGWFANATSSHLRPDLTLKVSAESDGGVRVASTSEAGVDRDLPLEKVENAANAIREKFPLQGYVISTGDGKTDKAVVGLSEQARREVRTGMVVQISVRHLSGGAQRGRNLGSDALFAGRVIAPSERVEGPTVVVIGPPSERRELAQYLNTPDSHIATASIAPSTREDGMVPMPVVSVEDVDFSIPGQARLIVGVKMKDADGGVIATPKEGWVIRLDRPFNQEAPDRVSDQFVVIQPDEYEALRTITLPRVGVETVRASVVDAAGAIRSHSLRRMSILLVLWHLQLVFLGGALSAVAIYLGKQQASSLPTRSLVGQMIRYGSLCLLGAIEGFLLFLVWHVLRARPMADTAFLRLLIGALGGVAGLPTAKGLKAVLGRLGIAV